MRRPACATYAPCLCMHASCLQAPATPMHAGLQVMVLSGGITNQLWKVFPSDTQGSLQPAVLRVFGEETDKFIDRAAEERNLLELNRFGFGAKVCIWQC